MPQGWTQVTSGLLRWVPGTGSSLSCVLLAVLAAAKTGNNRPIWQVEKLRPRRALRPTSHKRGPLLHPSASKLCAVSDPDKTPSGFSGAWSDLQQTATAFRRGQPSALSQGWAPRGAREPSLVLSPYGLTPAPHSLGTRVEHQTPLSSCFPNQGCLGRPSPWCLRS